MLSLTLSDIVPSSNRVFDMSVFNCSYLAFISVFFFRFFQIFGNVFHRSSQSSKLVGGSKIHNTHTPLTQIVTNSPSFKKFILLQHNTTTNFYFYNRQTNHLQHFFEFQLFKSAHLPQRSMLSCIKSQQQYYNIENQGCNAYLKNWTYTNH